jgi:ribosomal protein S24E
MEITVKEERENVFLGRKELLLEVKHENSSTPSKPELIKSLASMFNVDEKQVVIDYILTKKGCCTSVVKAKVLSKGEKSETQTSQSV